MKPSLFTLLISSHFETFLGTQGHGLVPFGANLSLTWSSEVGFIYVDGMHRTQKVREKRGRRLSFLPPFLPSVRSPFLSFAHPTQAFVYAWRCIILCANVLIHFLKMNTYDLCPSLSLLLHLKVLLGDEVTITAEAPPLSLFHANHDRDP